MCYPLKDLTGMRFGRLTVIERADHNNSSGKPLWVCRCDCGKIKDVGSRELRKGISVSCGCYRADWAKEHNKKHGGKGTRLYRIWTGMKDRCLNKNSKYKKNYSERGIKICDEWADSFEAFYSWVMSNGYDDKLTIDRIDNNGNYCPENCRWADYKTQGNNTRSNVVVVLDGESHTVTEWSEITGVPRNVIYGRLKSGWDARKALFEPRRKRGASNGE